MAESVRAVYEAGQLRLLDPADLAEGQQVEVRILSDRERLLSALGDLVVDVPEPSAEPDEAELDRIIEEGFRGSPPLSELIIARSRYGH